MRYSDLSKAPEQKGAVQAVFERLKQVKALQQRIVQYQKERSNIESKYADQLQKLEAKYKNFDAKNFDRLGKSRDLWAALMANLLDDFRRHENFSKILLRLAKTYDKVQFDADWSKMKLAESAMMKQLNEMNDKRKKLNKEKDGPKKDKLEEVYVILNSKYENEAPSMLESFEKLDLSFLNSVHDIIKQYLEHKNDMEINMAQMTESCNASCLDYRSSDEINEAVAQILFQSSGSRSSSLVGSLPEDQNSAPIVDKDGYTIPTLNQEKWHAEIRSPSTEDVQVAIGEHERYPAENAIQVYIEEESVTDKKNDLNVAADIIKHNFDIEEETPSLDGPRSPARRRKTRHQFPSNNVIEFKDNVGQESIEQRDTTTASSDLVLNEVSEANDAGSQHNKVQEESLTQWFQNSNIMIEIEETMELNLSSGNENSSLSVQGEVSVLADKLNIDEFVKLDGFEIEILPSIDLDYAELIVSPESEMEVIRERVIKIESSKISPTIGKSPIARYEYSAHSVMASQFLIFSPRAFVRNKSTLRQLKIEYNRDDRKGVSEHDLLDLSLLVQLDRGCTSVAPKPIANYSDKTSKLLWTFETIKENDDLDYKKFLAQWVAPEGREEYPASEGSNGVITLRYSHNASSIKTIISNINNNERMIFEQIPNLNSRKNVRAVFMPEKYP